MEGVSFQPLFVRLMCAWHRACVCSREGTFIDGHRGLKNEKVNEKNVMGFRLVLSTLYERENEVTFVIHTQPTTWGSGFLRPEEFLARLGYRWQDACNVLDGNCFWQPLAELRLSPFRDDDQVDQVHAAFAAHAERLPKAYEAYKQIADSMRVVDTTDTLDLFPELRNFQPPTLTPSTGTIPGWAEAELPAQHKKALAELKRRTIEVQRLRSIAGLLWATGDDLEIAVRDAFREMGCGAELTAEGTTYDVTVEIGSGKRFLVEVTGIGGMLKKDSNKIGQALQGIQHVASTGDRVLVAVNAHREKPVKERAKLDPVSPEAVNLLSGLHVPIIETTHLFEIWKTHLTDPAAAKTLVDDLYNCPGGLFRRA